MPKHFFKRLILVCVGILVLGLGISLFIFAGLGTDPISTMNLGISKKIGMPFGVWQCLSNGIFLVLMFFVDKKLIGIGTVINMISIGFEADALRSLFGRFVPPEAVPLWGKIGIMLAGMVLLGIGAALYISPNMGVSPYDSLGFLLSGRTGWDFRLCRIGIDALVVLIGWLTGAVVGAGTLVAVFCTGPFIRYFCRVFTRRFLPYPEFTEMK